MKKYALIFAVACLGGLAAIGLSKLFTKEDSQRFAANYMARYASLSESTARPDFVEVAEIVTPTVVHILTVVERPQAQNDMKEFQSPFDFFRFEGPGFNMPQQPRAGSGSGVIISQDGLIVTNNHVIDGATKIKVILNDKREYDAELLGKDANTDLALLRINEKNLPFALVGNSDEVKVGQWVLAVGNPFNLTSTVTAGIVSAKGRNLNINQNKGSYPIEAFIQTDAAVNPGNSGGALVSQDGKLVGINTAIASETGNYAGYAFAIPSNLMKKVITDLEKYGSVQRGVLGIEIRDVDGNLADEAGLKEVKGVYINKVKPNSAAEDAGLKEKDVILSVDGKEIKSTPELQEQIGKKNPGDKVRLMVLREGKERTFEVVLKNLDGKTRIETAEKIDASRFMDAKLETLSREERLKLHIQNGVRVKEMSAKSAFKLADVPEGFVITSVDKQSVSTITEVKNAFEGKKGAVLVEGVKPDGTKDYYAIKVGK